MEDDDRRGRFLRWAEENGIQLRGCTIKRSDSGGFGVFARESVRDVLVVTPLNLALTPVTIVRDPTLGSLYREMLGSEIDDRLLVMIFLMVERARGNSSFWAPYIDMLPSKFGTPLCFNDEELEELAGTTLFQATKAQLKSLQRLFLQVVKDRTQIAMSSVGLERELEFEDFLWANCIFWTRALNIPCARSFVTSSPADDDGSSNTVWLEGLVPGIDFCNHTRRASALWEIDSDDGSTSGVPHSMYLIAGSDVVFPAESEVCINYGDKGNEELLFLYGFVEEDNPNDYVMVHFPRTLLDEDNTLDLKLQLLQEQDLSLQWLLPSAALSRGFIRKNPDEQLIKSQTRFSWSGHRKPPSYLDYLVFPEEMLSSLRVLSMTDAALQGVSDLLQQLSRDPSKEDIQAAVWEVCGDADAFTLLVTILSAKMEELIGGTGTELRDDELFDRDRHCKQQGTVDRTGFSSENHRACVIYRKSQKQLVNRFLQEAKLALAACLAEANTNA